MQIRVDFAPAHLIAKLHQCSASGIGHEHSTLFFCSPSAPQRRHPLVPSLVTKACAEWWEGFSTPCVPWVFQSPAVRLLHSVAHTACPLVHVRRLGAHVYCVGCLGTVSEPKVASREHRVPAYICISTQTSSRATFNAQTNALTGLLCAASGLSQE